jgi:hypothetical protein
VAAAVVVVVVVIAAMAAEVATAIDAVVVDETVADCPTQRFADGQPPSTRTEISLNPASRYATA